MNRAKVTKLENPDVCLYGTPHFRLLCAQHVRAYFLYVVHAVFWMLALLVLWVVLTVFQGFW